MPLLYLILKSCVCFSSLLVFVPLQTPAPSRMHGKPSKHLTGLPRHSCTGHPELPQAAPLRSVLTSCDLRKSPQLMACWCTACHHCRHQTACDAQTSNATLELLLIRETSLSCEACMYTNEALLIFMKLPRVAHLPSFFQNSHA